VLGGHLQSGERDQSVARLDETSLEFARCHIRNFYDSDFFPKRFEFEALWANWAEVLDFVTSRDTSDLPAPRPRLMAAPKPGAGYRVVHQLDPIASLIYLAMAFKVAPALEAVRAPVDQHIACAYRVAIDAPRGRLFGDSTGYEGFVDRCQALARTNPYVLVTDIADFYNQIYLHRLQNVIATADAALAEFGNAVEDYLLALNARVSKGIPVGPAASIVMAEAVLNDIDQLIQNQGFTHTRYVDDIRVFSDSDSKLQGLLQEITTYLYEHHRLTLAGHKTEVLPSEQFVERYLQSPEILELQEAHSRLRGLSGRLDFYDAYVDEPWLFEGPPDPTVIQALMAQLVARPRLDLGLARHILRRCRQYRVRAIIPALLPRLDFFAPVMPAVILYLDRVTTDGFLDRNLGAIAALYDSQAAKYPFVRMWLDHYCSQYRRCMAHPRIRAAVMSGSIAAQAQGASALKDIAWVRRHKTEVDNLGPFDRRQVLRASLVLARDERTVWLRGLLRNECTLVDRLVITYLLAQ